MRLSLQVPSPICNVYHRRVGGGVKGNVKMLRLSLEVPFSESLTCINVVIFVGVGKMNVKLRFSLQVPPPIC